MRVLVALLLLLAAGLLVSGGALAAQGGPDSFGYVWVDSAGSVPVYDWDTTGATAFNPPTDGYRSYSPPGYSFTFYGNTYNTAMWIAEDGYVSWLTGNTAGYDTWAPQRIPSATDPGAIIAPFWNDNDLSCSFSGGVQVGLNGGGSQNQPGGSRDLLVRGVTGPEQRVSIIWDGVARYFDGVQCNDYNAYAIDLISGTDILEMHLKSVDPQDNVDCWDATIGIEDTTGTVGLEYTAYWWNGPSPNSCNQLTAYLEDGLRFFVNNETDATDQVLVLDMDKWLESTLGTSDDPLVHTALTPAPLGTLTGYTDGLSYRPLRINYTPPAGFYGADYFEYTVEDGYDDAADDVLGRQKGNVTWHVNAPPVAEDDSFELAWDDTDALFDVRVNDTDAYLSQWPDDITIMGLKFEDPELRIVEVSAPTSGGTAVLQPDGRILYTPPEDFFGSDTFTYTLSDGRLNATATVTVDVEAPPPPEPPEPVVNVPTIATNEILSLVQWTEADITMSLLRTRETGLEAAQLTYTILQGPSLGDLLIDGMVPSADPITFTQADINTSRIAYRSGGTTGSDSFAFQVTDPLGQDVSGTFTITVTDAEPPVAAFSVPAEPRLSGRMLDLVDMSTEGTFAIEQRIWTVNGQQIELPAGALKLTMPFSAGDHMATLRVVDEHGMFSEKQVTFSVVEFIPGQARFYASKETVEVGEVVTFFDRSIQGSSPIVRREWDFKDAVGPQELTVTQVHHVFTQPGSYRVALVITDALGERDTATHLIRVTAPEGATTGGGAPSDGETDDAAPAPTTSPSGITARFQGPPVADAGPDQVVVSGTVVRLDGTASRSDAGRALTFAWRHYGGTAVELIQARSAQPYFAVPYFTGDSLETVFELTVSDGSSQDTDLVRLVMKGTGEPSREPVPPPAADFAINVSAGGKVLFRPLSDAPGASYLWDFGDGQTSTAPSPTHVYSKPGTYTVRLTVTDAFGREGTGSGPVVLDSVTERAVVQQGAGPSGSSWLPVVLVSLGLVAVAGAGATLWWAARRP